MGKLLFTGGTGFLGKNIKPILDKNYEVTTIGITSADMLLANLTASVPELTEHYDVVLHACGKAHTLPKTDAEKQDFFDVNYQGTVNLCKALEKVGIPNSFIFISTLSVYGTTTGENIDESYPLNGTSPYAKSKLMAERYLEKWAKENGVILGILRPSLMAGLAPPGNLGAMIRSIKKGFYFNIDKGKARKSLLMVYDIANIVPKIAEVGGTYNVCDDTNPSYGELAKIISSQLGRKTPISIPRWMGKCLAKIGDFIPKFPINTHRYNKLTGTCTYSNEKAKKCLNWQPMDVLKSFKIK